ncbi:hypothetical protein GCU85_06800 [Cardiobacteriales bacterium ML27]|uniref:Uncharacterized protein n=1 Tax=Ostreibacterium oceani TaxID=2654998 RepID=A0A6N7EZ43_9GAMM|nr:hypothetical protein [Ostreibacterium oceani]
MRIVACGLLLADCCLRIVACGLLLADWSSIMLRLAWLSLTSISLLGFIVCKVTFRCISSHFVTFRRISLHVKPFKPHQPL